MTLDLDELTLGWDCPPGELRARVVVGRDGEEVVQIRLDLGLMQMQPSGRPDGQRCHGLPSAQEYIEHELRAGSGSVHRRDWQELERELLQTNYRRLAYATLVEDALQVNDQKAAGRFIQAALTDIEVCLTGMALVQEYGSQSGGSLSLRPTLVFDRARLLAQLRIVEGQFEEAIEEAELGAESLTQLLTELGCDEEQRAEDPGVSYLRDLGRQLRVEYGITQTLRERLEEALDNEDFETAAELRDALKQRQERPSVSPEQTT